MNCQFPIKKRRSNLGRIKRYGNDPPRPVTMLTSTTRRLTIASGGIGRNQPVAKPSPLPKPSREMLSKKKLFEWSLTSSTSSNPHVKVPEINVTQPPDNYLNITGVDEFKTPNGEGQMPNMFCPPLSSTRVCIFSPSPTALQNPNVNVKLNLISEEDVSDDSFVKLEKTIMEQSHCQSVEQPIPSRLSESNSDRDSDSILELLVDNVVQQSNMIEQSSKMIERVRENLEKMKKDNSESKSLLIQLISKRKRTKEDKENVPQTANKESQWLQSLQRDHPELLQSRVSSVHQCLELSTVLQEQIKDLYD